VCIDSRQSRAEGPLGGVQMRGSRGSRSRSPGLPYWRRMDHHTRHRHGQDEGGAGQHESHATYLQAECRPDETAFPRFHCRATGTRQRREHASTMKLLVATAQPRLCLFVRRHPAGRSIVCMRVHLRSLYGDSFLQIHHCRMWTICCGWGMPDRWLRDSPLPSHSTFPQCLTPMISLDLE
jgi:hypothetical protein